MSQKKNLFSKQTLSDLLNKFSKKNSDTKTSATKSTEEELQTPKVETSEPTSDAAQNSGGKPKRNVPKKRASKRAADKQSTPSQEPEAQQETEIASELPDLFDEDGKIMEELPAQSEDGGKRDEFFFDLLSFSGKNEQESAAEQMNIDDVAASISSAATEEGSDSVAVNGENDVKEYSEQQLAENKKGKKKRKSFNLVQIGVRISERNEHAKLIFIISMILLSIPAIAVALAVLVLFALASAATLLILGIMSIAILLVVTLGVLLSFVGVAYGAINLLTGEGFDVVIGQYELGLGTAIAGITIIVSALLYSGVTDLVPFIFKKMGQFFKFLVKKVKKLIVWLYRYSTQL